jgi:hypothetical protein
VGVSFDLKDYKDVPERIKEFSAKFPEGSLQSEITRLEDGWLCKAYAYRTADDPRPGIGHAFEPAPGKTPYTKDSEAMNAETSAWGRAIVALGFETKHIASANEVRSRTTTPAATPKDNGGEPVTQAQHRKLAVVLKKLSESEEPLPEGAADWTAYAKQWIVQRYGKQSRADLTKAEMSALIEELDGMAVPF